MGLRSSSTVIPNRKLVAVYNLAPVVASDDDHRHLLARVRQRGEQARLSPRAPLAERLVAQVQLMELDIHAVARLAHPRSRLSRCPWVLAEILLSIRGSGPSSRLSCATRVVGRDSQGSPCLGLRTGLSRDPMELGAAAAARAADRGPRPRSTYRSARRSRTPGDACARPPARASAARPGTPTAGRRAGDPLCADQAETIGDRFGTAASWPCPVIVEAPALRPPPAPPRLHALTVTWTISREQTRVNSRERRRTTATAKANATRKKPIGEPLSWEESARGDVCSW